jgi:sulfite exporter TauE/SafE
MTSEVLLPAAFAAGFFGSGHCFAMCGAVVTLLERPGGGWLHRLAYNFGRLGCYALLGTVAGGIGLVLTRIPGLESGLTLLRVLAAVLVIALGLKLLINLQSLEFLERGGALLWRRLSPLARRVLPATSLSRALAAGFIWGALPCGLVYSAVAMAAASGSYAGGALVMAVFWAGTLPALLAAGATAGRVALLARDGRLRKLCGLVLLVAGILALVVPAWHGSSADHEHRETGHDHAAARMQRGRSMSYQAIDSASQHRETAVN